MIAGILALAISAFTMFFFGVLFIIRPNPNAPKFMFNPTQMAFDKLKRAERLREFMEAK